MPDNNANGVMDIFSLDDIARMLLVTKSTIQHREYVGILPKPKIHVDNSPYYTHQDAVFICDIFLDNAFYDKDLDKVIYRPTQQGAKCQTKI